jgi:hypothetical protein
MLGNAIASQNPRGRKVEWQDPVRERRQDSVIEPAAQHLPLMLVGTLLDQDAAQAAHRALQDLA